MFQAAFGYLLACSLSLRHAPTLDNNTQPDGPHSSPRVPLVLLDGDASGHPSKQALRSRSEKSKQGGRGRTNPNRSNEVGEILDSGAGARTTRGTTNSGDGGGERSGEGFFQSSSAASGARRGRRLAAGAPTSAHRNSAGSAKVEKNKRSSGASLLLRALFPELAGASLSSTRLLLASRTGGQRDSPHARTDGGDGGLDPPPESSALRCVKALHRRHGESEPICNQERPPQKNPPGFGWRTTPSL
jgi:hypothetical protein